MGDAGWIGVCRGIQAGKNDKMIDLKGDITIGDIRLLNFLNLNDEEKELVRNWRNHNGVRRWMYSDHIISREEHSMFIDGLKKDNKNFYWLAKNKDEKYMGVIYLNKVDFDNKNAYLGIYSEQTSRLSGSGKLLIECLGKLSFDILDLHSLKLEVIENNDRAIRFYEKSGFSEEGRLREFVFKDGKWCDVIVMGIIKRNVGQTWKSE